MPFFKSKRVNFPLIIYCWNRAWHLCEVTAANIYSQAARSIVVGPTVQPALHCFFKLALICPLTMIVFDVPQVPKAAV